MTPFLFFFSVLGAFNGLVLSAYLLLFTKEKSLSKYLLGALILALSIRIGKSVFLYFDPSLPRNYLQVGLSACFFIGPFLYFYLKSVVERHTQLPKSWKLILIFFFLFITIVGLIRPYQIYPDFWNKTFTYIIYWQWLFFVLASSYLLRPILLKLIKKDSIIDANERWLLAIYGGNFIIFCTYFSVLYGLSSVYYITGPLVFSFFLYLAIFGYFYSDSAEFSTQKPLKKYANKKINNSEAQQLLTQLDQLMVQEHLYKNNQLKLKQVAEKLAIPTHRLSQLLNDNLGKSFATYINEYRIQNACQLLGTAHNLSLEGIGYEVGFKSKSTFFTTFKKIQKVTPAQYQQQIKQDLPLNGSIL